MKKMKYYIYLLCLPLLFVSCNDWLNVSPEDEIGEEELFADGEGYRNALNGIYKALAEKGLYGKQLTWGMVDAFGQYYNYDKGGSMANDLERASKYDFKHEYLKPSIESIWEKAYNAIANCNNIILNIENDTPEKFTFKEWEKQMIWGEALALRAFIQFDMLRLFAAAPVSKPTKAYIPYIKNYPSYISQKLTVNECLKYIIEDLEKAKPLVAANDTLADFRAINRFETTGAGTERFTKSRGYRLNYYAISALLARVYLYAGMNQKAYHEAVELIEAQEAKNYFPFKSNSEGGQKLYTDILAALYVPKVNEWDAELYDLTAESFYNWNYLELINIEDIYDGDFYYDDYYEITTSRDYRFKYQVRDLDGNNTYITLKNQKSYGTATCERVSNKMISLIRMSEVYYIAAEACAEQDLEKAKDYLFIVKSGRGLRNSRIEELRQQITSVPLLRAALLNDARREFVCEGQIFFMHKRMGEKIPTEGYGLISTTEEKMVLPLPDSEINIK